MFRKVLNFNLGFLKRSQTGLNFIKRLGAYLGAYLLLFLSIFYLELPWRLKVL
jgi:hypothetical protein